MSSELQKINSIALALERLSSIGEVLTIQIDLMELPDVIKKELSATFIDPTVHGRYRENMIFIDRASTRGVNYSEILEKLVYIIGGLEKIDGLIAMIELEYKNSKHPIVIDLDLDHLVPQVISVYEQKELFNISKIVQTRWIMSKHLFS